MRCPSSPCAFTIFQKIRFSEIGLFSGLPVHRQHRARVEADDPIRPADPDHRAGRGGPHHHWVDAAKRERSFHSETTLRTLRAAQPFSFERQTRFVRLPRLWRRSTRIIWQIIISNFVQKKKNMLPNTESKWIGQLHFVFNNSKNRHNIYLVLSIHTSFWNLTILK